MPVGIGPFGIAIDPTGTRVYVANQADGEDRLLAGSTWRDTGYVFTRRRGTPLDQNTVPKQSGRL